MRLEPCERRGQGAGKMSYNVVTQEGVRTFENIDMLATTRRPCP